MNTHKESIEEILRNRVKLISEGEWTLLGTPADLIKELEARESELAPLEPKEKKEDREWKELAAKRVYDIEYDYIEPTPPSQIEEESQTQRSLREMYELGKEHGRTLALKDMEIEKLLKEIKGE